MKSPPALHRRNSNELPRFQETKPASQGTSLARNDTRRGRCTDTCIIQARAKSCWTERARRDENAKKAPCLLSGSALFQISHMVEVEAPDPISPASRCDPSARRQGALRLVDRRLGDPVLCVGEGLAPAD